MADHTLRDCGPGEVIGASIRYMLPDGMKLTASTVAREGTLCLLQDRHRVVVPLACARDFISQVCEWLKRPAGVLPTPTTITYVLDEQNAVSLSVDARGVVHVNRGYSAVRVPLANASELFTNIQKWLNLFSVRETVDG